MIRKWFAKRFEDCIYWFARLSGLGALTILIGLIGYNQYYEAFAWTLIEGPVLMLALAVLSLFFMRRNMFMAWIGLIPVIAAVPIGIAWAKYLATTGWATRDWLGAGGVDFWTTIVVAVVVVYLVFYADRYRKKHGK